MWWFTQTWFYPSALLRQNSRPYFFRSSWKDVSQNHRKPIFRTSPWRLVLKEGGSVRGLAGAPAEDRLLSVYRRIWNQDLWIRTIPFFLFFFCCRICRLRYLRYLSLMTSCEWPSVLYRCLQSTKKHLSLTRLQDDWCLLGWHLPSILLYNNICFRTHSWERKI